MAEASRFHTFGTAHEDSLAYRQACLRWKSIIAKAPASDTMRLTAMERLHAHYCRQKMHKQAPRLSRKYTKEGGAHPLQCPK